MARPGMRILLANRLGLVTRISDTSCTLTWAHQTFRITPACIRQEYTLTTGNLVVIIGYNIVSYGIYMNGMYMMLTLRESCGQIFRKIGFELKPTTFEAELGTWVSEILQYV